MKDFLLNRQIQRFPSLRLVILVQLIFICLVFHKIVFSPTQYVFSDSYATTKSYFHNHSQIAPSPHTWNNEKIQHHEGVNQPYGAAISLTENSVATSSLQKMITSITGAGPISFALLNYLYLLGILLATLILYKILGSFLHIPWLIFILSISLPWLNPQINELGLQVGLSFSWIILLVIYLLILLWNNFENRRKVIIYSTSLVLLPSISVLFHFDLFAIAISMIASFCLLWGLGSIKNVNNTVKIWSLGTAVVLLSAIIAKVFFVNMNFSPNIVLDAPFQIQGLFAAYDFLNIPFFLRENIATGHHSYLGAFALYGILIFIVLLFFIERNQSKTSVNRKRMMSLILLVGLCCLGFGLIGKIFLVENKARFSWPLFWGLNFIVAFFADRFYRASNGKGLSGYLLVALLVVLVFDTADRMYFQMDQVADNPFTNTEAIAPIQKLAKGLDLSAYQAILPIPFYQNEKPPKNWGTASYQLSYHTGLRLMSADLKNKVHGIDIETVFLKNRMPKDQNRHSTKPILVFYSNNPDDYRVMLDNRFYKKLKEMESAELAAEGGWRLYPLKVD